MIPMILDKIIPKPPEPMRTKAVLGKSRVSIIDMDKNEGHNGGQFKGEMDSKG